VLDAQVTAVVLCYNQASYVRRCLEGVARQDLPLQLVIIDDASPDDSQETIKDWVAGYPKEVSLILRRTNQGVCRSINEASRAVRTPYVSFVAADDYWLPGKLARQLEIIGRLSSEYALIYSNAFLCNERGEALNSMFIGTQTRPFASDPPSGWALRSLLRGNFIPAPSVLLRTDCLRAVDGFDESLVYEDYDFWLRLSERFKFWYDDVALTTYCVRPNSLARIIGARLTYDTIKIVRRYLTFGEPESRIARDYISRLAYYVFAQGEPDGLKWLWASVRSRVRLRPALMLPLAALGLHGRRYVRFKAWIRRPNPVSRVVRWRRRLGLAPRR
jgi:glycosyltransferase involved in cell wall biosynthesis